IDTAGCSGNQAYTLTINPAGCPAITLTPSTLPDGTTGATYTQTISGNGGTAPYTFGMTGGSLPNGLGLDTISGIISGTPSLAGNFGFTLTASDANNCTGVQDYSINIQSTCLFCDDFEDGILDPQWTYVKPSWSEIGGFLIGNPSGRKAVTVATPV